MPETEATTLRLPVIGATCELRTAKEPYLETEKIAPAASTYQTTRRSPWPSYLEAISRDRESTTTLQENAEVRVSAVYERLRVVSEADSADLAMTHVLLLMWLRRFSIHVGREALFETG